MKPRHHWTDDEVAYLRAHFTTTRTGDLVVPLGLSEKQIRSKAAAEGLHKARDLIVRMARERSSAPDHGSRRTQFRPGLVPHNKGRHFAPPGSERGHFRSGQTNGRARMIEKPIGTLRINSEGYLDRKVSDQPGMSSLRWHPVHRLVWEAANGPVPTDHVVIFRPGMHTTVEHEITLDRVELVTRRELMRRNSVHTRQSPELARVTQLRGVLTRQINKRSPHHEQ